MPYYVIDIMYKTVMPSHLTRLQIIQNIKNLMFQVMLIFSDWISVSKSSLPPPLSAVGGNRFSKECCLEEWVISFCLGPDDKNLVVSFEWGRTWVKIPWINAFSNNMNSINLKIFPTHGGSLRENSTSILEKDKALGSL